LVRAGGAGGHAGGHPEASQRRGGRDAEVGRAGGAVRQGRRPRLARHGAGLRRLPRQRAGEMEQDRHRHRLQGAELMRPFLRIITSICIAVFASLSLTAQAQTYPAKPIRLVVGFAAGGPTDVIARIIAQDMGSTLGQSVLVENKTGANAMIATLDVKRAAPDGYTLLMTTLSHNVNAILLADQKPYDPINDFTPVTLVCFLPLVMVTKADSPFN